MVATVMNIPENSYIVMQAYGSRDILNECAFALLSLCRQNNRDTLKPLHVYIYTDQPTYFKAFEGCWLNLHFREVDASTLKAWRGAIDFVHRVKIEVLRDMASTYSGQILYLDTDVVFAAPVAEMMQRISEGKLYMHIMEGTIFPSENLVFQKLSRFFKNNQPTVNGSPVSIPENAVMWNAGVLGFHTQYKDVLEAVLSFTDEVYKQFPKHVVEQFAFSLYFQQTAPLLTAHNAIFHYWNLKELRPVLASFFKHFANAKWDALIAYSSLIQLPDYLQQKANFYYNRSTFNKLAKKTWQPRLPDWELLAQQI